MRKEISPEKRRTVTGRKKRIILVFAFVGILLLVWFKLPFTRTYTATLMMTDAGEVSLYGETVDVSVNVRVQRYFFKSPTHNGTVTVEGDTYSTGGGNLVPTFSLTGAFERTDSFTMACYEWHGSYMLTRCIARVEGGQIVNVYMQDTQGVYAGQYGPVPNRLQ